MRSKQRHPVQRAVDQSDKGWGSVPEVLLQAYPPKSTVEWERGLEPVSWLQAGEEGQQEPLQEETLDPKAAGDLDSQAGLTHKLKASHCAAFGQPSAGCYGAPSAIPILHPSVHRLDELPSGCSPEVCQALGTGLWQLPA